MNKIIKILIIVVVIILVGVVTACRFDLGPPWGITQKDISKMNQRWWVIYYKICEDERPNTVDKLKEIEKTLKKRILP